MSLSHVMNLHVGIVHESNIILWFSSSTINENMPIFSS